MTKQEQKNNLTAFMSKLHSTKDEIIVKFQRDLIKLLTSKGDDYSNSDRLSNFKEVAAMLHSDPRLVCLQMIAVKISRLSNLLNTSKEPNNESVDDTIDDLNGYALLLKLIDLELKKEDVNGTI